MRSRLLLPTETVSVHLHSKTNQPSSADSQLLLENNKQDSASILKLSTSVHLCLFSAYFFLFLPMLTSLSPNSLPNSPGLSGVGPRTLACVNLSGKQRVQVCTPPALLFFFFFLLKKASSALPEWGTDLVGSEERRGEPPRCCDLTKQTTELGASSSGLLGQQSLTSDSDHLRDRSS